MTEIKGDLISREALKRAICIKFYTTPYYKHILDEIDNAPTVDRPQGEWISVKERLPKQTTAYIVTIKFIEDYEECIMTDTVIYNIKFGWNTADEVIAWQPLPEPYEKRGG